MPQVVLCSKHEKAKLIAPILHEAQYFLEETSAFDTDTLGTFSGEVERTLTPKQAALHKARKACELTGAGFGLGSEGSFGGGPMPGFINWNEEILCLYERKTGRSIFAFAGEACKVQDIKAADIDSVSAAMAKHPEQRWIYRDNDSLYKALSATDVKILIEDDIASFPIKLEPDLRAMCCPERQEVIQKAAQDLLQRLNASCPRCQINNFVVNEYERGLVCGLCTLPTEQIKAHIKSCESCGFTEQHPVEKQSADPTYCNYCNP